MGWWHFTRAAIEALTEPADTAACDRAVRDLASDSRLGALLHRMSQRVRVAWGGSLARCAVSSFARDVAPSTEAVGIRRRGWMAVAGGVTVLGLNALKPVAVAPFTALVPSAVIAAGVLVMLAAAPLARAAADRRSRSNPS